MGKHSTHGFTIIETMLVLAITGLLVASLLAGIGTSIGVQRYRDSVTTLKSTLQDQYSRVTNVSNTREGTWACDDNAIPAATNGSGTSRGQSDCVLLGRYVSIVDGAITTASVVGHENTGSDGDDTELTDVALTKQNYTFGIASESIETSVIEWGSTITLPDTSAPNAFAMFILRSPTSGALYTFTTKNTAVFAINEVSSATLKNMMVENTTEAPGQGARTLCIDPDGAVVSERFSIYINAVATGPTAIESRSNSTAKSLGSPEC